jgi:hypothetical protein
VVIEQCLELARRSHALPSFDLSVAVYDNYEWQRRVNPELHWKIRNGNEKQPGPNHGIW